MATPWDALLTRKPPPPEAGPVIVCTSGETLTRRLLRTIDEHGPIETARLCVYCDLDSRNVWGLLKAHKGNGRVVFEDGAWSSGNTLPPKVARAAELLRSLGWTVKEPRT